jgi:hypothetical protein
MNECVTQNDAVLCCDGQNVETICGGATLPWREISDREGKGKGKGRASGSKADLLACMHELKKCGSSAANYARSLPGVKQLMKLVLSQPARLYHHQYTYL